MDPILDQVRQRTDELRRVADDVRRERDVRAAAVAAAVARTAVAVTAAPARPTMVCDDDVTCTPADLAA